ncbi:Conserved hypothetical protein [Clostridium kluyveri DSM 555]|uniref:Flagellar hook-length control protein-like C-terminal domain-containing protein n=1 Tax=Clostridium kluyveri (strain ATCC 8527 / DSM 555 / NBRC 12016 / NCIMB 10680 / K1) TaxID=431943 RepID=A5N3A4_CLOK5|nr:hypothetical protein [Clostridium kluyveri]EDK35600.1 Conserved hypothetical protein [Clostridium kluyveri DSM 555]
MAGIWNVNSVYNMNSKQISAKLSFEIGEKFSARVLNLNKYTGEILLKLLDGWKFSAQIDNPESIVENKLIRLQVEGFENDKLKLKIVTAEEKGQNQSKDSIRLFIKENSLNLNSEDYDIIEKMVKSGIPLTKENISNIKTTIDFINKIKENSAEEDTFIKNYLLSKNVDPGSQKGNFIKDTLKNFFSELKNISKEDLFILLENNIELNEDNIKSFNKVFKHEGTIYNEVKYLGGILKADELTYKSIENTENAKESGIYKKQQDNIVGNLNTDGKVTYVNGEKTNTDLKSSIMRENIDKPSEFSEEIKSINGEDKSQTKNNQSLDINKNISPKDIQEEVIKGKLDNILNYFEKGKGTTSRTSKDLNVIAGNMDEMVNHIKEQINMKTDEMKDIIRTFLEQNNDSENKFSKNIISQLNSSVNDFKLFNTISNSYYYMDLPINLNDMDYQCKLMIKDDRKKGKKIDATNVKIITSISTENMGIVDAYLTVNNINMNIDIKCNKEWVSLMKQGYETILESLSNIGYNIDIEFHEKKEEMTISTCREFFDDNDIGMLNTRA